MKYVFDTNVLISALLFPSSVPQKALQAALESGIVYTSTECFSEFSSRLLQKKFDKYLTAQERLTLIQLLHEQLEFADITNNVVVSRDETDNKFLSTSASINAEYLVTGDGDLLILGSYLNTTIIRPAEFISIIK
jgi:putative PIN family toxin of toxin-antitoxin system